MSDASFQQCWRQAGEALHALAGDAPPAVFDPRSLLGRLLRKALSDDALRTALFQVVEVLPMLDGVDSVAAHVRDYLEPHARRLGGIWRLLIAAGQQPLAALPVRDAVRAVARQFLAEPDAEEFGDMVRRMTEVPAGLTVDAVGEVVLSEAEADAHSARYLDLLNRLEQCRDELRGDPPIHVSVKLSALTPRFDPLAEGQVRHDVLARLRPIVAQVRRLRGGLTIGMEHREYKTLILNLFRTLVEEEGDGSWLPGIALQAYLHDSEHDVRATLEWARALGRRISIRLVKGAYWDTEVALATQRGWPIPVFLDKAATDDCFERLTALLFDHAAFVQPAIATHNLRSLSYAWAAAEARGIPAHAWEVQMLYGMAEPLRHAAARNGLNVRIYVPMGELLPAIAYLLRRLIENTADTSILRQAYVAGASVDELLAHAPVAPSPPPVPERPFANAVLRDFSDRHVRESFRQGLADVRAQQGRIYPLLIERVSCEDTGLLCSVNPAAPREILGQVAVADEEHAEQAIQNAIEAFPDWCDTPLAQRLALCRTVADRIEARRDFLAAWEVLEVGKNWREADADVAEAIDYFRYYALMMESLAGWRPTLCFPGEDNHMAYEPRGLAAIISPWNFPLAILAGMTAAALAAGNVVIMKPASPATIIACQFRMLLEEAGIPRNVCQLLPGSGDALGGYLVTHPDIHLIAFTGSNEVGLGILRKAHDPDSEQTHIKQVVCEMGGKNAVIVDDDADLDEAVEHILQSAFGYQGQKCSAASRVIAVGKIHDRLVGRLAAALDSQPYGPPEDPAFQFGPLISRQAQEKVRTYMEIGHREAHLYYRGHAPNEGYYHPPAIFTDVEAHHRLARDEIFGPVLAVLRASRFEDALALALDSDFALTGGVFSRLPTHLALAQKRFRVGNLYLNRRVTGARVGIQAFGGVRLSGPGIQTGGPDYIKQFLWTRVVAENTLRHGFVPPTH